MEKSNLTNLGVSEKVATFILETKGNKVINAEGLEVGDTFTVLGVDPELGSYLGREYVNFKCSGAREAISLGKLVGTEKIEKYFSPAIAETAIRFPRHMAEAVEFVLTNLVGKPITCTAIEENCGQYEQTFATFAFAE